MSEAKLHAPVERTLSGLEPESPMPDPDGVQRARATLRRLRSEAGRTDEDGLTWPSERALVQADDWLSAWGSGRRDQIPDSIVPDGEGGLVLERSSGPLTERWEISADGTTEHLAFQDCRLVERAFVTPSS